MKTFTDPNTTKEQERFKDATFIIRIELFRQHDGSITAFNNTAKTITVSGDCTALVSVNDHIFIPLHDYEITYKVSVISYSAGSDTTTLTLDTTGTLETAMIGLDIARRYIVSYGDTERLVDGGISPISFKTEGDALNEFMSDDVTLLFDNGDGFFSNKDDAGIFDNDDIFWVRIFTGYKNCTDRILFFGGLIDEESLVPDRSDKTFECTAYGHIKELERYPGYLLTNENGGFVFINGLEIKSFDASADTIDGVKKLEYKPFSSGSIKDIKIKRISSDMPVGIKVLEFRRPFNWRFDRGAWVDVSGSGILDANGDVKLYTKEGSGNSEYALVNFGDGNNLNAHPDRDEIGLVFIEGDLTKKVGGQGKPIIIFDEGEETELFFYFQRILVYDHSVTSYTEKSPEAATPGDEFTILDASDDALYIIYPRPFWGIEFLFTEEYSANPGITFKYSVGEQSFSAAMTAGNNGLADGTNGFTEDGETMWNKADGWRENVILIDTNTAYQGYIIKIERTGGSGGCDIDLIKPVIRCRGKNNDFLNIKSKYDALSIEDVTEDVIIRKDNGDYIASTWHQNIALQNIVNSALSAASYYAANMDIDDLKLTNASPVLNILGAAPKYNYRKKPTAVFVDGSTIYLGIENELWKVEELSGMQRLISYKNDTVNIVDIKKAGSFLYLFVIVQAVYNTGQDHWMASLKYDIVNNTYEQMRYSNLMMCSGRYHFRTNTKLYTITGWVCAIGKWEAYYGGTKGENLFLPFNQKITVNVDDYDYTDSFNTYGLQQGPVGFPKLVFRFYDNPDYKRSAYFSHGYFKLLAHKVTQPSGTNYYIMFNHGQQGLLFFSESDACFFYFWYEPALKIKTLEGSATSVYNKYTYCRFLSLVEIPTCGFFDETNSAIYLGFLKWYNTGDGISFSYISKYKQASKARDWTRAFHDNGGSYSDITTAINAGTASVQMNGDDDIYLGSDKKFTSIFIDFSSNNMVADMTVEYYNGSAWSVFNYSDGTSELTVDGHITLELPRNWTKEDIDTINSLSIDSVDRWWIRIRTASYTSGTAVIAALYNAWTMLWDSQYDNSGNYDSFSLQWMCYNAYENTIHGCTLNRDETDVTGFEYQYFVYDIANEIFYITQTGVNFTFNPSLSIKDFVYNSYDHKVYAVVEDIRYKDHPSYLISGSFSGSTITLNKETDIVVGEWGSSCPLAVRPSDGAVYGITKEKSNYLWQYAKTFYPRVLLADFKDLSFHEIMVEAAKTINQVFTIRSQRKALFYERASYDGEKTLYEYAHINDIKPVKKWQHIYDGVEVSWTDPFTKASGTEKAGQLGWRRKILTISSPFIQNRFLALALAQKYYAYFGTTKQELEADIIALIQLEERDRLKLIASSDRYNVDPDKWWLIHSIELDPDLLQIDIKGIG